ncbi:MAG: PepSY-associated TM helix domain-containing protein [Bacteroidota bacterium]
MTLKILIGKIHLWLGLTSGLVVFVVSLTGCLWVFQDELCPLFYADRMFIEVSASTERLPVANLIDRAEAVLGNQYTAERMHYPNVPNETAYVQFRKFNTREEGHSPVWYGDYVAYFYKVYLNPYTGEVVKVENTKWEFFNVVLWLHFSLLLEYSIGHTIVGYAVLIFVVMLITGLVLWWPKNKAAAKQRFWFRWKATTRWKRKNYDLHNIAGFYALIVALLIALTGLVWAFDWVDHSVQWLANGGKVIEQPAPQYTITPTETESTLDQIMTQMFTDHPEALSFYLRFPREEGAPLSLSATLGKGYKSWVSYQFNPYTGEQLSQEDWSDLNNGQKVSALNYPIHVGGILGFPGKVLAFLASLVSASLPITGFYIWWGRRKKKKRGTGTSKTKRPIKAGVHSTGKRPSRTKPVYTRVKVPSSSN